MEEKLKFIVRVESTDLEGNKPIIHALTKIKGISYSMANAICTSIDLDKKKKAGALTDVEVKKIESVIKEPEKNNIPSFLLNRQNDPDTGENYHLTSSNLKLRKDFDIKHLRKIRSYKGLRHGLGLPVRGQRTKGHFRKGKAIGVKKKKK